MHDDVFQTAKKWDIKMSTTILKCWKRMLPSIDTELASALSDNDEPSKSESSIPDVMFHKLSEGKTDEEDIIKWLNEENCGINLKF